MGKAGPKDGLNFYYCRYVLVNLQTEGPKDGLNFYYCRAVGMFLGRDTV